MQTIVTLVALLFLAISATAAPNSILEHTPTRAEPSTIHTLPFHPPILPRGLTLNSTSNATFAYPHSDLPLNTHSAAYKCWTAFMIVGCFAAASFVFTPLGIMAWKRFVRVSSVPKKRHMGWGFRGARDVELEEPSRTARMGRERVDEIEA
ncbi:hypothetical protein CC86DRAFT_375784 [Ophiobolus disseminans]|uniref:Uncharacterized protein n=1 Tax=Ophiobolus disseminans TaxID=1469910 RepID=A0A6A6ZBD9_9PLEO|nr:hypothetical protein CC86DRAFT_375784 [Ophiobolus disseminans]